MEDIGMSSDYRSGQHELIQCASCQRNMPGWMIDICPECGHTVCPDCYVVTVAGAESCVKCFSDEAQE